jgi:hypothetical protein
VSGEERILIGRREAAQRLGMSLRSFERFVQPEVPIVRRGGLRLVRVKSLEAWAKENEARTLEVER